MAGEDIERLRQAALKDPAQIVQLADALVASDRAEEAVQACRSGLTKRPDDVAAAPGARARAVGGGPARGGARGAARGRLAAAEARAGGAAPRRRAVPAPPPQPTPISRLQPMDDTSPSVQSFADTRRPRTASPAAPARAAAAAVARAVPAPSAYEEFSPTPVPPPEPMGRTPQPTPLPRADSSRRATRARAARRASEFRAARHERRRAAPPTRSRHQAAPEPFDLGEVADKLFGDGGEQTEDEARWQTEIVAAGPSPTRSTTPGTRGARAPSCGCGCRSAS